MDVYMSERPTQPPDDVQGWGRSWKTHVTDLAFSNKEMSPSAPSQHFQLRQLIFFK